MFLWMRPPGCNPFSIFASCFPLCINAWHTTKWIKNYWSKEAQIIWYPFLNQKLFGVQSQFGDHIRQPWRYHMTLAVYFDNYTVRGFLYTQSGHITTFGMHLFVSQTCCANKFCLYCSKLMISKQFAKYTF